MIFDNIKLVFLLRQWLPESARYQVACGNQTKAHDILKKVALANNKPMPLGKLRCEEAKASVSEFNSDSSSNKVLHASILAPVDI